MKKTIVIGAIILFLGAAFVPSITSQTPEKTGIGGGMRIDFFECIPSEENLSKAALIDFPSTIYLQASSLEEFRVLEEKLRDINPDLEAAYIPPSLEKSRFVSPFSYTYELENLIEDLQKNKQNKTLKVLLDLELPAYAKLDIKNLIYFHKNKKLIESIFERADEFNITIVTAEVPAFNIFNQIWNNIRGLSYPLYKFPHTKIIMFYSTGFVNIPDDRKLKGDFLIKTHNKYGDKIQVALGVIVENKHGVILSPGGLDADLKFFYEHGFKNACIWRLGGLDEKYVNVIKKYVT